MKIVCDENIQFDRTRLVGDIELVRIDGRKINRAIVADADVLLVRSVTRVDAKLLEGSKVRFVGTATSGVDHLDTDYLTDNGITWHAAPGSNADAVVDYCLACIAFWCRHNDRDVHQCSIGVVGAGHVGLRLAKRLSHLGCNILLNDPPSEEIHQTDNSFRYVELDALCQCDVVSLHVPFTTQGEHCTEKLISTPFLQSLPGESLFINSCRGEVVDEAALLKKIDCHPNFSAAVDVWLGEPAVNTELAQKVTLATPHIAGYSQLAKRSAAQIITNALIDFTQSEDGIGANSIAANLSDVSIESNSDPWQTVLGVFDVKAISDSFKQSVADGLSAEAFDGMRRQIANRKEFRELIVDSSSAPERDLKIYQALGFTV